MTTEIEAWLELQTPRLLAELFALIRCPSVSTDPAAMADAADSIAAALHKEGCTGVLLLPV